MRVSLIGMVRGVVLRGLPRRRVCMLGLHGGMLVVVREWALWRYERIAAILRATTAMLLQQLLGGRWRESGGSRGAH